MHAYTNEEVTIAPSGDYAFVEVRPGVVSVLSWFDDLHPDFYDATSGWVGTPAQFNAETIKDLDRGVWIDFGAKWTISREDGIALGAFARGVLASA